MAVSVLMPSRPQQPDREPTVDPLDRILKGLQIASSVYGLKNAADQSAALQESKKLEREKFEWEKNKAPKDSSILTQKEFLDVAPKYEIAKPNDPNAFKVSVRTNTGIADYLLKNKPEKVDETAALIKQGQLENIRTKAQEARAGKMLPASTAEAFGDANASFQALDSASKEFEKYKGISGPFQGRVSKVLAMGEIGDTGREAKAFDATLKLNAQSIGKYLEGGKLTDADIDRYKEMLPNLYDSNEVAQKKTELLKTLLSNKQKAQSESLQQAGFNVGNINLSQQTPQAPQITPEQARAELIRRQGMRSTLPRGK